VFDFEQFLVNNFEQFWKHLEKLKNFRKKLENFGQKSNFLFGKFWKKLPQFDQTFLVKNFYYMPNFFRNVKRRNIKLSKISGFGIPKP